MTKIDFEIGSSTIDNFLYWINERHRIYINRFVFNQPKPWSDDPIFQQWKFTNVFRELDVGTMALKNMIRHHMDSQNHNLLFFNIFWYRLFNLADHAENPGFVESFEKLETCIRMKQGYGGKIFTTAHLYTSSAHGRKEGETNFEMALRIIEDVWDRRFEFTDRIRGCNTMEEVFNILKSIYSIGNFLAYEMTCDLRFTTLLCSSDHMDWVNIGPGAKRGLRRLGLPVKITSLIKLYYIVRDRSMDHVRKHFLSNRHMPRIIYPPFELREIEHSLCEFDKYERIRLGQGRPKQKYKGY